MKAQYLSHYLSDRDVANFARQSFASVAENFTEAQNNNLIRFLARGMASGDWETVINDMLNLRQASQDDPFNERSVPRAKELATYLRSIPEHWVPFGHPVISLRMSAPIPIRVQCFKHKVGFVESEESRRYISTRPEIYIPEVFRSAAANVKQGSAGAHPRQENIQAVYRQQVRMSVEAYEYFIEQGVCAEQARFVLPQGATVNWVWTGSLYAYAHAYNLRTDPHAQQEVRDLFEEIGQIIEPLYPVSWRALTQGDY